MIIDGFFYFFLLDCIQKCSKIIQIKTEVLYAMREINNYKTMKNISMTNFNQNLRSKSFCLCMKYIIVCGMVYIVFQCILCILRCIPNFSMSSITSNHDVIFAECSCDVRASLNFTFHNLIPHGFHAN